MTAIFSDASPGRDDDGSGMSDQQLCDELKTLMVAGLDTTALALSWRSICSRAIRKPTPNSTGDRTCWAASLHLCRPAEAALRRSGHQRNDALYPPAWGIGREALRDCEIGAIEFARVS